MKTQKSKRITLDADFLLDDLLFWAMRYISHRSTYATSAATDYAKLIAHNRHKFSQDRLLFFAKDIRSEISSRVGFNDNIKVRNCSNHCIKRDAYSLIKEEMMRQDIPWTDSHKYRYDVDCMECTCAIYPLDKNQWNEYCALHNDIDVCKFVCLADIIDREFKVAVKCNYMSQVHRCIESIEWIDCHNEKPHWEKLYISSGDTYKWLCSEYIVKIEPIIVCEEE